MNKEEKYKGKVSDWEIQKVFPGYWGSYYIKSLKKRQLLMK